MPKYNLEEFKEWLKTKNKEDLMPSGKGEDVIYYGIENEQLFYQNLARMPRPSNSNSKELSRGWIAKN